MSQVQDRLDLRRRLVEVARGQAGYFTTAQALAAGYSYSAQRYHVHRGNWEQVDRALLRLPEWPIEPEEQYVRWFLWSRERSVVSHDTALAAYDISDLNPARIHLTVPPDVRMTAPGLIIHKAHLPATDVQDRGGYRITTPLRSVLDVAATPIEIDYLATAIEDGERGGYFTRRILFHRADAFGPAAALAVERAVQLLQGKAT